MPEVTGPLAFQCPHCKVEPGFMCVQTFKPDSPYAPHGKPMQHLLRWILAHDAARADGATLSLDDLILQQGRSPEPKPLDDDELASLF